MIGLKPAEIRRLESAYEATQYYIPHLKTSIIIGLLNEKVDQWLSEQTSNHAIFITAYNPYSEPLSIEENKSRNEKLLKSISEYKYLVGLGIPQDSSWLHEESFLVANMPYRTTLAFMAKFEQLAVVWHSRGQESKLIWNNDVL